MLESRAIAAIRLTLSAPQSQHFRLFPDRAQNCPRSAALCAISGLRPNLAVLSAKASAAWAFDHRVDAPVSRILAADAVSTAAS